MTEPCAKAGVAKLAPATSVINATIETQATIFMASPIRFEKNDDMRAEGMVKLKTTENLILEMQFIVRILIKNGRLRLPSHARSIKCTAKLRGGRHDE